MFAPPENAFGFHTLADFATGETGEIHIFHCSLYIEHCTFVPMTSLTKEQVLHIAKLARLTLTSEEVTNMTSELSSILGYVEVLSEVDTADVEPTAQVTGLKNALREDTVHASEAKPDDLLAASPLTIVEHQIQAPHAHG